MISESGHVLIVDDNRLNRIKLSRGVEQQGHTVDVAEDGKQAIQMLRANSFDLVLLDIVMPEMDGHEVLEQMKLDMNLRDIPVVVVSALDELDSVVRCIQMGAEDYLPKSFDPVLLRARIDACLEKKRLRDQEALMAENLRQENARADALLHAMLPPGAVSELKANNEVKPRRYADVAVLFCDIVGFTAYCDVTPPEQVVNELQTLISKFEALTEQHGLEKIKTIGDAYMATAGLMRYVPSPLSAAVRCGLEMVDQAGADKPHWQVRIGIQVGPVVAGIVGHRQYLFDVWGDTVNLAARICEKAPPCSVVIGTECWQDLKSEFSGRSLGQHELKGKGTIELVECRTLI